MLVCDQLKATLARYMTVSLKLGLKSADLQGYAVWAALLGKQLLDLPCLFPQRYCHHHGGDCDHVSGLHEESR